MSRTWTLQESRAIPVEPRAAFERTLPMPLHRLFRERYGPIPPIARTSAGPAEPWGTPGQRRTVHLSGGGSMREELLAVDPPLAFTYRLTSITGPLAAAVTAVDGEWTFDPVGTGVRVTWRWRPTAHRGFVGPPRAVFSRLWHGYARVSLAHLSSELLAARAL